MSLHRRFRQWFRTVSRQVVYPTPGRIQGNRPTHSEAVAPSAPGVFHVRFVGAGAGGDDKCRRIYTHRQSGASGLLCHPVFDRRGANQSAQARMAVSRLPPRNIALPVSVRIAGRTAQLLYAGSAPETEWICAVNAVIPAICSTVVTSTCREDRQCCQSSCQSL